MVFLVKGSGDARPEMASGMGDRSGGRERSVPVFPAVLYVLIPFDLVGLQVGGGTPLLLECWAREQKSRGCPPGMSQRKRSGRFPL